MTSVAQLPAKLPAIAESGLPVSYEAAKQAIAECESPFECRTMADKAAAMAVYARMRDDTDLLNRAVRLQAWAARRWGELDKALHPDRRQENLKQNVRNAVDHNSVEQPKNADFNDSTFSGEPPGKRLPPPDGTTDYHRVVSRRLAAIPEAEFTRQVESANPPTVTQLAAQGTAKRTVVLDPEFARPAAKTLWSAITCAETRDVCETLERFAAFCKQRDPTGIGRVINATEAAILVESVTTAAEWLDRLAASLGEES